MHQIIKQHKQAILNLCHKHHVARLSLFGSVLQSKKFKKDSDVDILVSFKIKQLSLEAYTDAYFQLTFDLEDLLKRSIDITTERSLSNPYFIQELERTKVVLFDAKAIANGQ